MDQSSSPPPDNKVNGPFPSRNVGQIRQLTAFVGEFGQHGAIGGPRDVGEI